MVGLLSTSKIVMTFSSTPQEGLPEDADLLKAILPPLLADFQHWFGRTISLLEGETINFLSTAEQSDLLTRVRTAQQQVSASQALSSATDSQAGIAMSVVMGWHKLVHECWGVALRLRKESAAEKKSPKRNTAEAPPETPPDYLPPS